MEKLNKIRELELKKIEQLKEKIEELKKESEKINDIKELLFKQMEIGNLYNEIKVIQNFAISIYREW